MKDFGTGLRAMLRRLGRDEEFNRSQRLAARCAVQQLHISCGLPPEQMRRYVEEAMRRFDLGRQP